MVSLGGRNNPEYVSIVVRSKLYQAANQDWSWSLWFRSFLGEFGIS